MASRLTDLASGWTDSLSWLTLPLSRLSVEPFVVMAEAVGPKLDECEASAASGLPS